MIVYYWGIHQIFIYCSYCGVNRYKYWLNCWEGWEIMVMVSPSQHVMEMFSCRVTKLLKFIVLWQVLQGLSESCMSQSVVMPSITSVIVKF